MLTQKLRQIVSGPADPDREFILSEYTYKDIYLMAAQIRRAFSPGRKNILLFTEDKAVIAAAVLGALAADFSVILPYALSNRAMEEIREGIGFDAIIGDRQNSFGTEIFSPEPVGTYHTSEKPLPVREADTPFVKFFTGGSTGRPKIWTKTPENIFGEAFFQSETHGFSKQDRILCTSPPYHIYGFLFSVLVPFVSSSGVLPKTCSFPEEIRDGLKNGSPTIFAGVPMHYRILNGREIPGESLRLAVSSAGKLDKNDGDYFHEKTGVELIEIYGSTETGGIASRRRGKGEIHLTPFKVVDWKVVHERLHVRSPFISPEIEKDAEGYYQTGDRVRKIDDHRFSLLGRADGVVKVGGKRVDIEDVQNKIKQLPRVADAVVFSMPGGGGRETDICAVVQGEIDMETLKSMLLNLVEPYAMPRRMKIVDKIPVSASGKYDRRALKNLL